MGHQKKIDANYLWKELVFSATGSSGPGGQHVNRVNTKVNLRFDIVNSGLLSEEEKQLILKKLASKITGKGVIILSAQAERSQLMNKEAVTQKLNELLEKAFFIKKKRKPTRPSKSAIQKRLDDKKKLAEKKMMRKNM
ncbi:MAG: aminoacyl-tRNA hydrolase [Bacteroidetes bacterium]|nr:aminoacyl-tRNA hydrolase [Bacteroidota bacterium]MCH8234152.1 aminoacyl-tRNA hydrolase [Bacteroidota bacterium]